MLEQLTQDTNQDSDLVEFLGLTVDLKNVLNPHLKKIMACRTKNVYRFGYNNHSRFHYPDHDYPDHSDYSDHKEKYHENTYSDYPDDWAN